MLADTLLPHGFGAALASVDTFSKGSRTVRYLPALPCRLPAMGRTVGSSSSSPDNHFQQLYRSHYGLPTIRETPFIDTTPSVMTLIRRGACDGFGSPRNRRQTTLTHGRWCICIKDTGSGERPNGESPPYWRFCSPRTRSRCGISPRLTTTWRKT